MEVLDGAFGGGDFPAPRAALKADLPIAPFFDAGIFDAEGLELVLGPIGRPNGLGGAGQSGADAIGQFVQVLGYLAFLFAFEDDPVPDLGRDEAWILSEEGACQEEEGEKGGMLHRSFL